MTCKEYQDAVDAISGAQSICIITHLRPDADAIGSATALLLALKQRGKNACAVIGQDKDFAPNLYSIPAAEQVKVMRELPQGYDLYVTVDCGAIDRTGLFSADIASKAATGRVLCIDHHSSNARFGSVNLVDSECESTTVVILTILDMLSVQIESNIAHCLYAGLVTDTGSFRWGRPTMHDVATRLMQFGLDTKQIATDLLDATTPDDLQMIGRVLAGLRIEYAGELGVGILVAGLADIDGHSDSAVESLVDFVRALEDTELGVVFKEQSPGIWAVSLRSTTINCVALAATFGGGGHVPAAGYMTSGSEESIIAELVSAINEH
ncbi:DHH family phosphoesterase [Corynebacterium macginleyi]|uniref:DHH family phosphoesterase n=1 Tax=Corynebacterium macginleyi TaxID=38290 RepID=UPI00190AE3B0|nr:bifunctional oligoribonuclease/PAP phosphatase NrnA [Corynebacterium macginleyi]MBK4145837.1 bifunctional oligoribonuclease/PAP phosphatase NrnA [Corynebacterium macginleyi]MBK4179260.1 bifunctional oligoribonuclease/PAP phosphatase NrnA [Corynebacterium macginleyi]MBM0262086.1 bifunctional oligoribonuclease/PAP phosphatase NrnA [Corynebacterium macginleyi]